MDTNLQSHRDNRLLAALAPKAFELMRPDLRSISLKQGHELYEPGDDIDQIYFPQNGLLSLLVVTKDGRFFETSTVGRDGAVGLQAGLGPRVSFTRANVQITGKFSVIRADRFAGMVQDDPALRDLISRYIEILWAEAQQIAACNVGHDASARLCRWLLQCADRIDSDTVALTQEFLAQMLGVRRTTVTVLAKSLQEKGVIEYRRGQIHILDRERLKHCACECYHVMQSRRLMPKNAGKLI
jgi:CRP-like cAMP-binding protein